MIFYLEGPLGGELLERALYERGTDLKFGCNDEGTEARGSTNLALKLEIKMQKFRRSGDSFLHLYTLDLNMDIFRIPLYQ